MISRVALSLALPTLLLVSLLGMGACARGQEAPFDPYAPYRPAVKEKFQSDFDLLARAPRYAIDVDVDLENKMLTGTAEVIVTNDSLDPWQNLVFRLYPVLSQYGGEMTVQSVLVDNQPATFTYQAENTAIQIDLLEPLLTDRTVSVALSWRLTVPSWPDDSSVYALFGSSQQMTSLPLFYPSLAVYQAGPSVGTGEWWMEMGSVRGDAAFNRASLFVVTATLPADQVPITSGTLISSTAVNQDQTRYVWAAGPAREFLLHMSALFRSLSTEAYGTRITSYWLPGDESTGRAALDYAVGSLRYYSDYFGEYPYRDMRVGPAPLTFRGMEYPQVNLLGVELYDRFRDNLEVLVAHEVAHQWWYQIVHNDPVRTPWLDEALAEYSVKLYYEALHGSNRASFLQLQRWQMPVNALEGNDEVALDRPVDSFKDSSQYETIIYGKGALLYARLRNILGDRPFRRFMRDYLATYRYGIVDTEAWLTTLQEVENPEIDILYMDWVQSPIFSAPHTSELN